MINPLEVEVQKHPTARPDRNVAGYDAAYLAVAEAFDCPLVTADARLSRVPDIRCEVRLALPA